jgi:hypothetical protein
LGGRGRRISEFEASLVYRVSSSTARAIQRNPVLKNQKTKTNQPNKQTNKRFLAPSMHSIVCNAEDGGLFCAHKGKHQKKKKKLSAKPVHKKQLGNTILVK